MPVSGPRQLALPLDRKSMPWRCKSGRRQYNANEADLKIDFCSSLNDNGRLPEAPMRVAVFLGFAPGSSSRPRYRERVNFLGAYFLLLVAADLVCSNQCRR